MKRAKKRLNFSRKCKVYIRLAESIINEKLTKMFMQYYFDYKEKRDAIESAP